MAQSAVAAQAGPALAALRARRPLTHVIANYVSMDVTANALLALGASPAMVHAIEEVEAFVGLADALSINVGTLSKPWVEAMLLAAEAAQDRGLPWTLDPVGVGATRFRDETSAALLARRPTAIRGNATEIMVLARLAGAHAPAGRGKGVDSGNATSEAEEAARALALATGAVVAATGDVDFVTDGRVAARIVGGHALMPQVTALGCALSATAAAFLAAEGDAFTATAAALAAFAAAGAKAGAQARGPGSFRLALLDELAALAPGDLAPRIEAVP
ncbi:MAG: hydroxyethylthiazole kinase [Methylobacteriaceae bacterium]|nr:hydroxyethylthiazole kinase [Methylobacteriaceae bacterium]